MTATAQVESRKAKVLAREYETIYILRPNADANEANKLTKRLVDLVEKMDGKLTRVNNWGKRKLAYSIRGFSRGVFIYLRYVGDGNLVSEIQRNLRVTEPVVRFQTVQVRADIDVKDVKVDPEEVKLVPIEITADEQEPGIEERLGLKTPPQRDRVVRDEYGVLGDDDFGDDPRIEDEIGKENLS